MNSSTHRARPARRLRAVVPGVLITACVGTLVALAVQSPGYAGSSVTATVRTVWVTNSAEFLLGRINRQINELDSAAALSSADFDVRQSGDEVFAVDYAAHQLRRVDPATVTLSEPLNLPVHATVALGGGVLAVGDTATGRIWTRPADDPGAGDLTRTAPAATVAPGVTLAVGADGAVAAAAPGQSRLTVIPRARDGAAHASRTVPLGRRLSLPGPDGSAPVAVTTVGTEPVVLDRPARLVIPVPAASGPAPAAAPGAGDAGRPAAGRAAAPRAITLPHEADDAMLQQAGPAADAVLVATGSALLRISLPDGTVGRFASGTAGTPVAPVWLDGCAHAAWSGQHPTYLAWCGAEPTIRPVPVVSGGPTAHALVFRVNRSEIVLNDIATGDSYLLDKQLTLINNWSQVAPPRQQDAPTRNNRGDEKNSEQATLSRTNCAGHVTPPVAEPDSFGVRAGLPAILPVMANDATTDCSVAIIDSVTALPSALGTVAVVDAGRALQVTAAADATGTLPSITYRLSDGTAATSSARVALTVVPPSQHPEPVRLRPSATLVGVGGSVTDDVLQDWYSPSGDPLWLTAVSAQGQDLAVGFEPNGAITVRDTATGGPGKRTVTFALTDGVSVAHGTLSVQVVAPADATPLASPVYVTGRVGVPIALRPLDSVLNPGTDPASVSAVTADPVDGHAPGGLTVSDVTESGVVTVTAAQPGDYRLHYQVAAGALSAEGAIRVVVAGSAPAGPVAVTDVGYLAPDGQVRLDLTANDLDDGAPLAVREVHLDPESPLVVTLSDMHVAHVSARRVLPPGGAWFSYVVSDGTAGATGWVHIVPVPQGAGQGPVASPARLTVRAGDAGTLPIGAVAQDPDGNAMAVADFAPLPAGQGLLFAAGDAIRYLAPAGGLPDGQSSVSAVYTVTDTAHRSDSASLTITVVPPGGNHAPTAPAPAVARVFAGASVTVALPLDGIDPDGDWVTLSGVGDAALGSASEAGPDSITYRALGRPGADTVRYTAADPFGKTVTGLLQVVVVPPPTVAQPPVAPDLKVAVAPGGTVGVDVLGAVTDPAGLPVTFAGTPTGQAGDAAPATGAASAIGVPATAPLTARVADGVLAVTARDKPAVVPIGYTVVNTRGLSASGVVTVTITPDAQAVPPTAADVFVDRAMVSPDGHDAVVSVADRVTNPGGRPGDLTVAVDDVDSGSARATGRLQVTIPLTGRRQVIAYQVKNAAGLVANAFIVVLTDLRPRSAGDQAAKPLQPDVRSLVVDAGQTVSLDIRDYVTGAPPERSISLRPGGGLSASTGRLSRVDTTHLTWVVPVDAPQDALLSVDVTDGQANATARIPATVRPAVPAFQSTAITVAAGGTTPVNLAALVTARPGQRLTFAGPTGSRDGVGGRLSGSTLTVSAAGTAAKGTRVDLGVSVSDGAHPAVRATVTATVVASTAPPAFVPDLTVNGAQGVSQRVDVLAGARNPVPDKGPLTVVGARVISGSGRVLFAAGGTVSITPAATQLGGLVVQVTVADATGDPDRQVTGTVTVTVAGKPGRVTGVKVVSVGDRTVNLAWAVPPDNGRPLDYYLVRGTTGGYTQRCPATRAQCPLTGLTNDRTYRFTVTAHNALGDSAPSAPSDPAVPDVAPDAPAAPDLTFGDGSITATWHAPADRGSPITGYLVSISPAPRSGPATVSVKGATTYTFDRLTNGTGYQVTVVAQNSSGTDSDPSASTRMVPAAPPDPPAAPGLTYDPGAGTVNVSWTAPDGHGDDQLSYRVQWTGAKTSGTVTVPPGRPLSATISPATLGKTYTATVTATNKAGTSPASVPGSVRAFIAVDAPTAVRAVATGADQTVAVTWNAPAYSGWDLSRYQYQIDGGGAWANTGSTDPGVTIQDPALTNGAPHKVSIRACTQQSDNACGAAATSGTVRPFGPPGQVQDLTASAGDGSFTVSWGAADGNGRDVAGYRYSLDGGASWHDVGTALEATVAATNGTRYTVAVQAYHAASGPGQYGQPVSVRVTPVAPPPPPPPSPTITMHAGSPVSMPDCYVRCHYISLNLSNFRAGTYTLKVYYDHQSIPTSTYTNQNVKSGTTRNWQFGSYAGDHSPGNYYKIRIVMTGPQTVDSGWQTFVNQ